MKSPVEIRMPKYPDCWETCGSCGSGEVAILGIMVKPGDRVGFDDTILTLETGKVALDIPSPRAGRVVEVCVAEGEAVAEGQLLMTIEPA
jgi:pyruvate/2-oxoglutarate dehydrogenase complex dihydrolipoamide acyltransferase (E2) component